uniref:Uncharacterized protein n=1 Tax=Avena sativa TaxID=4498 RepID=A0ACD5VJZ1_AVESA
MYFAGFFGRMVVRRGQSGEVARIKSILDQISENQLYRRIEHTPSSVPPTSPATTAIAPWRDDLESPVGFDKDIAILKGMLVHKEDDGCHPLVISIVGESGAGKNTLVKSLCHQILTKIDVLIRYDMQPNSSTEDLLMNVYRMALRHSADQCHELKMDEEGIDSYTEKIRGLLSRKRYLLILSGISSKSTLNFLRASLPDNNGNGGHVMLILDTTSEEVAWHANTMNKDGFNGVHMMTCLDRARSAQLFFWKVLRKSQYESWLLASQRRRNPMHEEDRGHYMQMSTRMVWREEDGEAREEEERGQHFQRSVHNVTGGYPMAIVLLAGLLRFKEKSVQWDGLINEINAPRYQQPSINTRRVMESIFWTSFKDLSNNLKSCFLYLATCPQDTRQDADEIIRIWIAEGFIINKQPHHGKTLEEVGHDYLKELVLRCLVELEVIKPNGSIGVVRVIRSLLRFLRSEVTEAGFMEIIHDVAHDVLVPPLVRRLSVQSDKSTMYTTHQKFPRLRSFLCHVDEKRQGEGEAQHKWTKKSVHNDLKFLRWSKFLRVVSVKGLRLEELPDELGDMIHLRYLCIDCPDLHHLPSSIARLLNLQTLDISNTQVEEINQDFWKIKTLRHVLAKCLVLPIMSMSAGVGEEEDDEAGGELQTLHGVKPAASGSVEWSMLDNSRTRSLRSLEMHGFCNAEHGGPVFEAALKNMHLLGHLSVQGDEIPSCVFVEPYLRSLQTMELRGNVKWEDIIAPVADCLLRQVRPNIVQLKMSNDAISKMPRSIKQQLKEILVQG